MIGFRGASRYYHERYRQGFALECRAIKKVREEMGLTNLKVMIPFCRTVDEGRRVQLEMARHGLTRGVDGLEVYMMCEIPSNVILASEFAEIFDGFSIGSNDLTQLILGVDRDSEIVAPIFDERNPAVKTMIAQAIAACRARGRKIGICGQAAERLPGVRSVSWSSRASTASFESRTGLKDDGGDFSPRKVRWNWRTPMNSRKRFILSATDFSPHANDAATVAAKLALRRSETLVLVHVTDSRVRVCERF
jgi:hypothetical protein